MGGHETGGGLKQKWGDLCPPGPDLKPPLLYTGMFSQFSAAGVRHKANERTQFKYVTTLFGVV